MVTKILMVCLGNICRSPLAEGLLQSKIDPTRFFVDSAGTGGYHVGEKPDERSIMVAAKYGLDISQQRCRKLTFNDLKEFDYIYAMDRDNYRNILSLAETASEVAKVHLLLDSIDAGSLEVPDPYYGGKDGFEHVYKLIDAACQKIAAQLQDND